MKNARQLENIVSSVIESYPHYKFLIAVSGGADSMALLSVLCARTEGSPASPRENLNILHVDHGLRGREGKDDAEFVRAFCEERAIPCKIVVIPPGEVEAYAKRHNTGIEAAARHFRRKALLDEANLLDNREFRSLILTAHTKNDALELSLMRILRGAGPAGLAAMPVKNGRFLRPLLGITRAEITAYLKENNIPWREDSSNTDEKFLRNKIRHKLIPFLDELFRARSNNNGWKKAIEGLAETQSLAAEFIEQEAESRILWEEETGNAGVFLTTNEAIFFAQPQIIKEEAIFKAINLLRALRGSRSSDSASPREGLPKRYVVRTFCEGNQKAADLGPARITGKKGKIILNMI